MSSPRDGAGEGRAPSAGPAAERAGGGTPAFRLRGVRIERGGRPVLRGVDLEVPDGRISVLLGPSGSGKTSLLRVLNRLDDPAAGSIRYRGRALADYPVRELRRRVGFVFQTPVMFDGSVEENLRSPARLGGWSDEETERRVRQALELAELPEDLLGRPADELSVGQQQRANLARALVNRPETLLLDEPTSALDAVTSRRLLRTFRRLTDEEGRTAVMATHREEEARAVGDRAVLLRDGGVAGVGAPESLL